MAFSSGTALSVSELIGAVKAIAETNGWTVNKFADVTPGVSKQLSISNGDCYANLFSEIGGTKPDDTFPERIQGADLSIKGSTGYSAAANWDAQPGTHSYGPKIGAAFSGNISFADDAPLYPASYWCFAHTTPAVVVLVVETSPDRYQWMMMGELKKFGTWTGGGFVMAGRCAFDGSGNIGNANFQAEGDTYYIGYLPFSRMQGAFGESDESMSASFLHCEVNAGTTWQMSAADSVSTKVAAANVYVKPLISRSPNQFNAVSAMVPPFVFMEHNGGIMPLGVLEHVRYCPLTYFDPGDIFTLGSEKWMVFPGYQRGGITGNYGFAVRYDGP